MYSSCLHGAMQIRESEAELEGKPNDVFDLD